MGPANLIELAVEQTRDYALFVLDPHGYILTWNTGAQLIKGYRPDEFLGRHFSVFYTQDALERGWPTYELTIAAADTE